MNKVSCIFLLIAFPSLTSSNQLKQLLDLHASFHGTKCGIHLVHPPPIISSPGGGFPVVPPPSGNGFPTVPPPSGNGFPTVPPSSNIVFPTLLPSPGNGFPVVPPPSGNSFPTVPPLASTQPRSTGFPMVPPSNSLPGTTRTTRQTTGTPICVPTGTCATNGTGTGTGTGIDPRIVSPGQGTPAPAPTTCPAGQVLCYPVAGGARCGTRYVTTLNTADGPSTLGAYPWVAYLRNQSGFAGSGVLIDTNNNPTSAVNVLTAAHKVYMNAATPGNIIVNIGVWDAASIARSQQRTVARMVVHPNFDRATLKNDIAVLRLSAPVPLGYQINVNTACLPAAGTSYVGQNCVVAGWGRTGFTIPDAPTSPQKQVTVPIVNYNTCRTGLAQATALQSLANVDRYLDPNGELCAGGVQNRDACTNDGGSPLMCGTGALSIAGLVIWGKSCGLPGVYGVYVDVPKYRTWIDGAIATLNAGR